MNLFGPIVPSSGPSPCKIAIVAEAPGDAESEQLRPLVGPSGWELRRMLKTIGVNLDDCYKTNVFGRQPMGNNVSLYGVPEKAPETAHMGPLTTNPITYLNPAFLPEIHRLSEELASCKPNIIIALGNVACWALLGQQGITALRGSVHRTNITGTITKVLPTYHPAAVLRQWEWRVIALADLEKAHNESFTPDFAYDNSELWLNPTYPDLLEFGHRYMEHATECATDVETKRGQITAVSFAPTPDISIAIPFWLEGPNPDYWHTVHEEAAAWRWVQHWIEKPDLVKVMQNGMYDTQYFMRHGMKVINFTEDTMLAHHSLYSELQKGLGFLGSIYTNTVSWKKMRTFRVEDQLKKDD